MIIECDHPLKKYDSLYMFLEPRENRRRRDVGYYSPEIWQNGNHNLFINTPRKTHNFKASSIPPTLTNLLDAFLRYGRPLAVPVLFALLNTMRTRRATLELLS